MWSAQANVHAVKSIHLRSFLWSKGDSAECETRGKQPIILVNDCRFHRLFQFSIEFWLCLFSITPINSWFPIISLAFFITWFPPGVPRPLNSIIAVVIAVTANRSTINQYCSVNIVHTKPFKPALTRERVLTSKNHCFLNALWNKQWRTVPQIFVKPKQTLIEKAFSILEIPFRSLSAVCSRRVFVKKISFHMKDVPKTKHSMRFFFQFPIMVFNY